MKSVERIEKRQSTKIELSRRLRRKTITTAAQFEYDRPGFEGYLGNVGYRPRLARGFLFGNGDMPQIAELDYQIAGMRRKCGRNGIQLRPGHSPVLLHRLPWPRPLPNIPRAGPIFSAPVAAPAETRRETMVGTACGTLNRLHRRRFSNFISCCVCPN